MNHKILCAALIPFLCGISHADTTTQVTAPAADTPLNNTMPTSQPSTTPADITPTSTTTTTTTTTTPDANSAVTPDDAAPVVPLPENAKITKSTDNAAIDCNYHIPAGTSKVDQSLVQKWAEQAATQSFELNPETMDNQLTSLKTCYTDQGWQGFNDALQKSGNLDAIKNQHLTVSSSLDGPSTIIIDKDNQWNVSIPMQVIYQNDKEKLTQVLTVNLLVGRKESGDLGIMQMIAVTRPQTPTPPPATNADTTPPTAN